MGAEQGRRSRAGGARAGHGFGLPRESWGGGDRGGSGWARPDRQGDSGPSTVPRGTRTYAKPWEEDEALGGVSRGPLSGEKAPRPCRLLALTSSPARVPAATGRTGGSSGPSHHVVWRSEETGFKRASEIHWGRRSLC